MAYIPKIGSFTLFKNDKKQTETQPDYRGDGLDLMGEPIWVSAWLREGAKGKVMSCLIQHKNKDQPKPKPAAGNMANMDNDIPF